MSDPVRLIADAVLYEGYLLWPYRRSAAKNRHRWTFGCVMPRGWCSAHAEEPFEVGTECLLEDDDGNATVSVEARFLQVVRRQVLDATGCMVGELLSGGTRHLTWDEAAECVIREPGPFRIRAGHVPEPLENGSLLRRWQELRGALTVRITPAEGRRRRVSVTLTNTTPGRPHTRDEALQRAFGSAHVVLRVNGGAFLSPLDPAAASCRHHQLWPVLVGEPPDRSTILASAFRLDEYPKVAPESPADLFDGGEIDQLLTLNILCLTDTEKEEMRAGDPRARAILDRVEAMTGPDLMRLHGTIRDRQVREAGS